MASREAADAGSSAWDPAIHAGDLDGVLGPWLGSGPGLIVAGIWEVNQSMEDLFVLLCLSTI